MEMERKYIGNYLPIDEQIKILSKILSLNSNLMKILEILDNDAIKDYYVGAGCINQTIFNYYHNFDIDYGIKDYDIVYYDKDTSYEKEDIIIKRLEKKFENLNVVVDIKNEARVHLWYYEKYKVKRLPYVSVEDAIASWGATITCIGVRLENNKLVIYAPYGLEDIFGMTIRPVKRDFSKKEFDERANRWMKKWPRLKKIEW